MLSQFSRTEMILGEEKIKKLNESKIIIFGVGGVGSFAAEAFARCGVGNITLVDNDKISVTNINRQIHSLHSTLDEYKTEVMKKRILDINPNANVLTVNEFVLDNNISRIITSGADYIIDAVDTVTAKLAIIEASNKMNIKIISCMGTGNKIHPEMLEITDIYKTSVCPLAKVMRRELKKRNIQKLKVCFSKEIPIIPYELEVSSNKSIPGSVSFVPPVAGLIIAGEVIRDIIGLN